MEAFVAEWAGVVALGIEAAAILVIAFGSFEAFVLSIWRIRAGQHRAPPRRDIWVRYAVWLMLGLEFELAADVVRTAIAPSWVAIGQLGAIAAIRTVLNYFLGRDIREFADRRAGA